MPFTAENDMPLKNQLLRCCMALVDVECLIMWSALPTKYLVLSDSPHQWLGGPNSIPP